MPLLPYLLISWYFLVFPYIFKGFFITQKTISFIYYSIFPHILSPKMRKKHGNQFLYFLFERKPLPPTGLLLTLNRPRTAASPATGTALQAYPCPSPVIQTCTNTSSHKNSTTPLHCGIIGLTEILGREIHAVSNIPQIMEDRKSVSDFDTAVCVKKFF